jgi:hypothetical protein
MSDNFGPSRANPATITAQLSMFGVKAQQNGVRTDPAPDASRCIVRGKGGCVLRGKDGKTFYDKKYKQSACKNHGTATRDAGAGGLAATVIGFIPAATIGATIVGAILGSISLSPAPPWCTSGSNE